MKNQPGTMLLFDFYLILGGLRCESTAAILYSFYEENKQDHNSKGCLLEASRTHEMASKG